jgi:hypothetical protein
MLGGVLNKLKGRSVLIVIGVIIIIQIVAAPLQGKLWAFPSIPLGTVVALFAAVLLFSGARVLRDRPIFSAALFICAGILVLEVLIVTIWVFTKGPHPK